MRSCEISTWNESTIFPGYRGIAMKRLRLILCLSLLPAWASVQLCEARAAGAAEEVEYYAVFADGAKIGHSEATRKVADGKVTTRTTMEITLTRDILPISVGQSQVSIETTDGRPLGFKTVQDMALTSQTVEGTVEPSGKCRVKTTTAGRTQETLIDWPPGAMLNEGLRLLQLRKGLAEGTTYAFISFDTFALAAMNAQVRVGPKRDVDLLGRVVRLTEVQTVVKSSAGAVTMTSFVDDQGRDKKSLTSAAGINLEIVACNREAALSPNQPVDFFSKVILSSPRRLEGLSSVRSVTYYLAPSEGKKLTIPAMDAQTVRTSPDGTVLVTIGNSPDPSGASFPYAGNDPAALAAMKPARYLESDRPEIVALAKKAVGDARDAVQAARRIETFVRGFITTKDLSVGYATAAEVAASRQGDCTEHAVLTAAMCRAAGIPAQVVVGVAYVDEFAGQTSVFGPHAWVRAFAGGKWIGLDGILPHGWDAGHIALAAGDGNPSVFFGTVTTLGYFKIVRIDVKR